MNFGLFTSSIVFWTFMYTNSIILYKTYIIIL